MNINEYLKQNRHSERETHAKRLICKDGFSMSVQASEYHYCQPRITGADFYYQMEVGFPSEKPQCFAEYAEGSWDIETDTTTYNYTDTVYGYVPVEFIDEEIALHGGIVRALEWGEES